MRLVEPTLAAVEHAAQRIAGCVHRTPVITSRSLDERSEAQIFVKCENLQRGGAFKARGASNAILSLDPEIVRFGVATHSSGNHGQAVAVAAAARGMTAQVVMPRTAARVKRDAVAAYGATVRICEPTQRDREATLQQVIEQTGASFIPPYDDPRIIAGQGTVALELLQQVSGLDAVIAPVGGGGLLSGTAIVASAAGVDVYGAEPAGADDAYRSLLAGERLPMIDPQTIADGLRTTLGRLPFEILRPRVGAIFRTTDAEIVAAMRWVWERMKLVIEASAAVPVAACLQRPAELRGRRVGLIISGGNVDLEHLPWMGYSLPCFSAQEREIRPRSAS